jgi:hypothetical protein
MRRSAIFGSSKASTLKPSDRGKYLTMSDELLQFIIVVAFGAVCFGCGYLIAFIVTRNKYRDEMIKRGLARYNQQTGKWEWGEPPKEPRTWKVE